MNDIKIGDVVPWADVPDGALARRAVDDGGFFYLRRGEEGWCVGKMQDDGEHYFEALPANLWPWRFRAYDTAPVTIIALGLTGHESADDLRRLAEVFEVREDLHASPGLPGFWRVGLNSDVPGGEMALGDHSASDVCLDCGNPAPHLCPASEPPTE